MHILYAENEAVYSNRWSRLLKHLRHTVTIATTYDEAVKAFEAQEPDLVICDNDLDDCDTHTDGFDSGYFFIAKLRKEGFAKPIIFYTGNPRSYFQEELDLGWLDVRFIRKRLKRKIT